MMVLPKELETEIAKFEAEQKAKREKRFWR